MKRGGCLENYPWWMVFFSNFVSITIYFIGAYIIYKLGFAWSILYLIYILTLEFRLVKRHCTNCYYYGKICAFGKGKISSMFFKNGDVKDFCKKQMTWKDMIPDLMVSLIPLIIGIIILIKDFDWLLLLLMIILFILASSGSGIIRSKLACKYCKQRKIGCPAQKLFEKKK